MVFEDIQGVEQLSTSRLRMEIEWQSKDMSCKRREKLLMKLKKTRFCIQILVQRSDKIGNHIRSNRIEKHGISALI